MYLQRPQVFQIPIAGPDVTNNPQQSMQQLQQSMQQLQQSCNIASQATLAYASTSECHLHSVLVLKYLTSCTKISNEQPAAIWRQSTLQRTAACNRKESSPQR